VALVTIERSGEWDADSFRDSVSSCNYTYFNNHGRPYGIDDRDLTSTSTALSNGCFCAPVVVRIRFNLHF
jgi:hypothetical protein